MNNCIEVTGLQRVGGDTADVKVLALNPPHQPLPNADYNALESDPESWLSYVTEELERFAKTASVP